MNAKVLVWSVAASLALSVAVGLICVGASFFNSFVLFLFVAVYGFCWPFALTYRLSIRRRKQELIQALTGQPRWIQDEVLAELDPETRSEFVRELRRADL
ncbi:MAG TPA: hypothetical protein VFY06_08320 [Verrucomicrobiae bacterium]|nr:hypothetical protein [Verrucomicrobiae bacterium]